MAWTIELLEGAEKELAKLDRPVAGRIRIFLHERLAVRDDPRSLGKALTGSTLGEFWQYRVGDYRIIARIENAVLRILVVRVGHRREVYK